MLRNLAVLVALSSIPSACCSGGSAEQCATCLEADDPDSGVQSEPCTAEDPDASDDGGDAGGSGGSVGTGGASGSGGSAGASDAAAD